MAKLNLFGSTDQLVKMKIGPTDENERIEVLFNPTEYTLEHSVTWKDLDTVEVGKPVIQFTKGNPEKLTFELLVDTTDQTFGSATRNANTKAEQIVKLARIDGERHEPPVVAFEWGKDLIIKKGVIESIKRTMMLFDPDGTPTRIKMTMTVKGFEVPFNELKDKKPASPDRTRTVAVAEGDTLPAIAFRAYGEPSRWREIALANGITDPARLAPGTILEVPRLEEPTP